MVKTGKSFRHIRALALVIASVVYFGLKSVIPAANSVSVNDEFFYVTRAIDGDTLKLSNGRRVRLIGVDTPEAYYGAKLIRDAKRSAKDAKAIQVLGRRASAFTKRLCEGRKVRMEFDVERHDRYGRTLAYVYLEDGTFVNAKILEEGYGKVMTIPPNVKYSQRFLQLQQEAREKRKGLWDITDFSLN